MGLLSRKERHAIRKERQKQRMKRMASLMGLSFGGLLAVLMLIYAWQALPSSSGGDSSRGTSDQHSSPSPNSGVLDQDQDATGEPSPTTEAERNANSSGKEGTYEDTGDPGTREQQKDAQQPSMDDEPMVTLAFVGDTMMAGNVARLVQDHGYDYPFLYVKEWLQQPDFTIANLETPITDRGEPEDKTYVYRTSPDALPALLDAGIDVVNIANNHILDYGHIGFYDTLEHLEAAGLFYIGGGRNLAEALEPVFLEKSGVKIAVLGFSRVVPEGWWKAGIDDPGVAETYDYTKPIEAIEQAAESADLVVVFTHWGKERESLPDPVQTELAYRYIDAGADLVVGSHPHVLQGAEQYKGKWIFYSLGNFIFTTNAEHEETWESVILNAECTKDGDCELQVIPILNKWGQPKPLVGEDGAKLLRRLSEISLNADVNDEGMIVPAHDEGN